MSLFWRIRLMILGVVAVALVGFGSYWGVVTLLHSRAVAPFKPHLAEYLAPTNGPVAPGPAKGKLIVLDRKTGDVDWDVFFALPPAVRASRPEEVGAVALVDWGKELDPAFGYGPGVPAYWQTCAVTVVDHASRRVIGNAAFKGGEPPSSIDEHDKEGDGPKPTQAVIAYLQNLPRQ